MTGQDNAPSRHAESLPALLRANARRWPDALAVIDETGGVTFAELFQRAARVAGMLRAAGVGANARVGLLLPNGAAFLECVFGIGMLGAVAVPLSTWSTVAELAFLLNDSEVVALLASPGFGGRDLAAELKLAAAEADRPDLAGRILTPAADGSFAPHAAPLADADWRADPGADAMILYTSGSTSRPKGVRLTQQGCCENGFHIGERQGLRPGDRVLLTAPLFWSYGLANATPAAFGHGAALVLAARFDPAVAQAQVRTHRCTAIYTLPAITTALLEAPGFDPADFASLRTGLTIGTAADVQRTAVLLGVAGICNIYGATETYGNCCVTWHHWPLEKRMACQGPPLPGQVLRFRHPETGDLLPQGTQGVVEVSGRVSPGYVGAGAEQNLAAFTGDGFYRTGDMGYQDAEGNFHFVGRDSEMIKRSGINVSPSEVEQALQNLPEVAQCVVVGVPDVRTGEAIVAFVVPAAGRPVQAEAVRAALRRTLSSYKLPDHVLTVARVPLTVTGKVQRRQARDEAIRLLAAAAQGSNPEARR